MSRVKLDTKDLNINKQTVLATVAKLRRYDFTNMIATVMYIPATGEVWAKESPVGPLPKSVVVIGEIATPITAQDLVNWIVNVTKREERC